MTIYHLSLVSSEQGSGHRIRLLELLPNVVSQPIRRRIQYADLDNASIPSYDALLYCREDAVFTETIIMDRATSLEVTANFYFVLKQIRDINLWLPKLS